MQKFRLNERPKQRKLFCEILLQNIEDYKRLGYDTKLLEKVYEVTCE